MIDPKIFESLQTKIDDDTEIRDQIRAILQVLERQGRTAQSILSGAHSTPAAHRKTRHLVEYNPDLSCSPARPPIHRRRHKRRG
jgi:hypothetical protein